jgi:hypothetical protein
LAAVVEEAGEEEEAVEAAEAEHAWEVVEECRALLHQLVGHLRLAGARDQAEEFLDRRGHVPAAFHLAAFLRVAHDPERALVLPLAGLVLVGLEERGVPLRLD